MSKHLEPEILKNREDLESLHGELLKRYDWYLIRDLQYLKNKNNLRIFYLEKDKIYAVITGKDFKREYLKKLRKRGMLYADKPHRASDN